MAVVEETNQTEDQAAKGTSLAKTYYDSDDAQKFYRYVWEVRFGCWYYSTLGNNCSMFDSNLFFSHVPDAVQSGEKKLFTLVAMTC